LWLDIAVLRGLESRRPASERLLYDPVSFRLLPAGWRLLLRLLASTGLANAILVKRERQLPGVIANLLCRTRYIDDALRGALDNGAEQVLILGAGFDTRAYRIPGTDAVPVFEVDHPDAQAAKRKALERSSIAIPENVTFVPVDFERDDLGRALAVAGFRSGRRTFFIWEGVTQYISRAAIADTLAYVGTAGGAGSVLAFSYIRVDVIEGSAATATDRRVMARAQGGGAPWRTGLDPAELPALLERHGLRLVEDVGDDEFRTRYLEPAGRTLATLRAERVALAEVVREGGHVRPRGAGDGGAGHPDR
jgi:methyltransferase (TIGR00027 family)